MLSQAVTTVWRTELGTTLLDGFNSTTDGSAYFRHLCSYPVCHEPPIRTKFLSRLAPHHTGGSLLAGSGRLKGGCGHDCPPSILFVRRHVRD
jgi:hypothetical protein